MTEFDIKTSILKSGYLDEGREAFEKSPSLQTGLGLECKNVVDEKLVDYQ